MTDALQKYLDTLIAWSISWLLRFHLVKCKHLRKGRHGRDPNYNHYLIVGKELEMMKEEGDIG